MTSRIVRLLPALFMSATGLFAQAPLAPGAAISGRITNPPATPITVKLRALPSDPSAPYDGYLARPAPNGSFSITDIEPGSYQLTAEAPEFMPAQYQAGALLVLSPGRRVNGITIALTPKRALCGIVTDPDGRPTKAVVSAELRIPGIAVLAHPKGANIDSDDAGRFRFSDLPPGEYFLRAHGATGSAWFPSSSLFDGAQPIEVAASTGTSCNDNIRLRSNSRNARNVRGTVVGPLPQLPRSDFQTYLRVELIEENSIGGNVLLGGVMSQDLTRPNQPFDFPFASTGRYRLIVRGGTHDTWSGPQPPPWYILASKEIIVENSDVNDVTLELRFASLSGQVRFEGITKQASCPTGERQYVSILKEGDGQYQQAQISADGTFSFPYVDPGIYTVSIFPTLPKSVSMASMVLNGQDVPGSRLDLSSAQEHKLTASLTAASAAATFRSATVPAFEHFRDGAATIRGEISGRISNAPASDVTVTLKSIRFNSRASAAGYSVKPATDGTFRIAGVDPGLYVLSAKAPGFVPSQYGASGPGLQGTPINLAPGQKLNGFSLPLTVVPTGMICGRLTDQTGSPISNGRVHANGPYDLTTRSWNSSSPPYFTYFNEYVRTDAAGNYRISNLKPGAYFLSGAGPSDFAYFPSSRGFNDAQLVQTNASPAAPCQGDIRALRGQTVTKFHARGRVVSALSPSIGTFFYVSVTATNPTGAEGPREERPTGTSTSLFLLEPDQTFDVPDLTPGQYRLHFYGRFGCNFLKDTCMYSGAIGSISPTIHSLGSLDVTVTDADVNGLALEPPTFSSISGQVEFAGDSKTLTDASERRGVSLYDETNRQQLSATLNADGTFGFLVIDAGNNVLRFAPDLLANGRVYATAAFLDGTPIQEGRVTVLPQTAHQIKVVLGTGTGQLRAEVTPSDLPREPYIDVPCRERIFGGIITSRVFLIPETPTPLGPISFGGHPQGPEQPLHFETSMIPPGQYRVLASEYAGFNIPWLKAAGKLIQAVAALGQPIDIKAGETANVTLLNSTAEIQALRARLGEPLSRDDY